MKQGLLRTLLEALRDGNISVEEAMERLVPVERLGFATLDLQRPKRTGFPEVIFAETKTDEQVATLFSRLTKHHDRVLATRVRPEAAQLVQTRIPDCVYHETSRTLVWTKTGRIEPERPGYIAVVCAGTSDLPVAEEAAVTAEIMGSRVLRVVDVGVAGLHRLLNRFDEIANAEAIVVCAGMEGALASVVAGLVEKPVIAVPTSVGYGANFHGLAPLLGMLNACAPGIAVVNIDNGFGAGYYAALIHRLVCRTSEKPQ